jgi:hypothetical protein
MYISTLFEKYYIFFLFDHRENEYKGMLFGTHILLKKSDA